MHDLQFGRSRKCVCFALEVRSDDVYVRALLQARSTYIQDRRADDS